MTQVDTADWLTVAAAASRLGLPVSVFRKWADEAGIEFHWRKRLRGVVWGEVEAAVERSRLERVSDSVRRELAGCPPGVALLDRVKSRFSWSDRDVADALLVWPSVVCRWRINGVPEVRREQLRALLRVDSALVPLPRRVAPKPVDQWWEERRFRLGEARVSTR